MTKVLRGSDPVTLYDAAGRPIPNARIQALRRTQAEAFLHLFGTGGYTGARTDKRGLQKWQPTAKSADSDTLPDLETLRSRSRDLFRNAPLAAAYRTTTDSSVVGTGLRLKAQIDREVLGLEDEEADAWERQAERIWRYHAGSGALDITGQDADAGLASIILGSTMESGDILTVRRFRERPGDLLATRVQLVEADRITTPPSRASSDRVRGGVEIDADGRPVAYWVANDHPGEIRFGRAAIGPLGTEFTRVRSFDRETGQRLTLHHAIRLRTGQRRGVPILAPVMERLKQYDRFTEAELAAAVLTAFFAVFTKSQEGLPLPGETDSGEPNAETGDPYRDADTFEIGPWMGVGLPDGTDVTFADPKRPNEKAESFLTMAGKEIGAAIGMPWELLVKHFQSSYSAARAALLEAWRFFRMHRAWLVRGFFQPTYGWVIEEAVARGRLRAPGFFDDPLIRQAWLGAEWIGNPQGHVQPVQEAEALAIREDRGWVTGSEATAEASGGDWEQKVQQRARERRVLEAQGMEPPAPIRGGGASSGSSGGSGPEPEPPEPGSEE